MIVFFLLVCLLVFFYINVSMVQLRISSENNHDHAGCYVFFFLLNFQYDHNYVITLSIIKRHMQKKFQLYMYICLTWSFSFKQLLHYVHTKVSNIGWLQLDNFLNFEERVSFWLTSAAREVPGCLHLQTVWFVVEGGGGGQLSTCTDNLACLCCVLEWDVRVGVGYVGINDQDKENLFEWVLK